MEVVENQEKCSDFLFYCGRCHRCNSIISFIDFYIYQGIKSEREKQKSLSSKSNTEFNNLDKSSAPGTKLYADVISSETTEKYINDARINNILLTKVLHNL